MRYPYITYCDKVRIHPIVKNLSGEPFILDLSDDSPLHQEFDLKDQKAVQRFLEKEMRGRYTWGLAPYLEKRGRVLSHYPQMMEEQRFYHLGLDVIVQKDTKLHAPLDAVVIQAEYEPGEGNFGGHVLLGHDSDHFDSFYSLYAHLNKEQLPPKGTFLSAGDAFARAGDFNDNGNWFYHTHIQVITQKGVDLGYASKGYCSAMDLDAMDSLCPSPLSLFCV